MVAVIEQPQVRMGAGSEGGHWYVPTTPAQCAYEIMGKNGKWRPVNMRDARQYGWFPGVSSVTRIPASPGLDRWKLRQGILSALTHPKVEEITDHDELIQMIETDSKEQAKKAAEIGTAIHKAIEDYFQTGHVDIHYEPYIKGAREQIKILTGIDDIDAWTTEEASCHPYGYGGRVDLYSKDLELTIDFKGKEFSRSDRIKAYPEQGRQLAAYRALCNPGSRTVNLFVSRNEPGLVRAYEWSDADIKKCWDEFRCLLRFWQVSNGFNVRCQA